MLSSTRGEIMRSDVADSEDGLFILVDVHTHLLHHKIVSYLEASCRGGHLWVFSTVSFRPSVLRRWLLPYISRGVEFYPRQDTSHGYRSLRRLPLGVHRRSGRLYPFIAWTAAGAVPVALSVHDTLAWLSTIERVEVQPERRQPTTRLTNRTHPHTPITTASRKVLQLPATSICAWCAAQDPSTLIGRYMRLDARGMECCWLGEHHFDCKDSIPSFRVNIPFTPGGCYWHCYTPGKGGNVFHFLARYHRLDARTLRSCIRAGEVF